MKLIMENWRGFLREAPEKENRTKFVNTLIFHLAHLSAPRDSPAELKGLIKMFVRGYNQNPAVKKAEDSVSSSELKKIDKVVKTIKDIAKSKDKKEIKWKWAEACKAGAFGRKNCILGSVVHRYDRASNTSKVLQFNMMKQPESTLAGLQDFAVRKLGPFLSTTGYRKGKPTDDFGHAHKALKTTIQNFSTFIEALFAIFYSCTYVHELYHYYEFSKEFKHDTEEYKMMKHMGYRNPEDEDKYPKEFIGSTARSEMMSSELRAIQAEEDYLKILSNSLPIHIKKQEKFPGYVGSWVADPRDPMLAAALSEVFEKVFAEARVGIVQYRKKQHRSLYSLFNNRWEWGDIAKLAGTEPVKTGPYTHPDDGNFGPRFTSTGQVRSRASAKALTGPAPRLPRIKRKSDPRSD